MPVNPTTTTNFLYRIEAGSSVFTYNPIVESAQSYNDEVYTPIQIKHSSPTWSSEPSGGEIDLTILESSSLNDIFINGPPAYEVIVNIYEYDRETGLTVKYRGDDTDDLYYRGWIVRSAFLLDSSTVTFRAKSRWRFFERESLSDSISALSRYSIYDPRSGVDFEPLRVPITISALNDERDILTVTGITEIDDWFTAGIIVAPDRDKRTILKHTTEGGLKKLYLNGAFPMFTLASGFPADIYPGDDLTYDTWANKFSDVTNHGEAWGGWQYTPNVDPALRGVI